MDGPEDDFSTYAGRLAFAIRKAKDWAPKTTPTRTERETKLGQGYVSRILDGTRVPGADFTRRLSDYLHVSFEWLLDGTGPPFTNAALSSVDEAAGIAQRLGASPEAVAFVRERDATQARDARGWLEAFLAEDNQRLRAGRADLAADKATRGTQAKIRREKRVLDASKAPDVKPRGRAKRTG